MVAIQSHILDMRNGSDWVRDNGSAVNSRNGRLPQEPRRYKLLGRQHVKASRVELSFKLKKTLKLASRVLVYQKHPDPEA